MNRFCLVFATAITLLGQSTPPTSVLDSHNLSDIPTIANSNFAAAYSGVGAYGTSLPTTCEVGQKYSWQWTGVTDMEYRCLTTNQWTLTTALGISGNIPVRHMNPIQKRIMLSVGDNVVFTCPASKQCSLIGSQVATNDGSSVQYSTGTLSLTYGSSTVTGVGTIFTSGMNPARIHLTAANVDLYVTGFGSSTSLTLSGPWFGSTSSGLAYTLNYGAAVMGQYMIHNGTRYEMNTGAKASVPGGATTNVSCCMTQTLHVAPGDSVGYTISAAGVSTSISASITDQVPYVKSINVWGISGGSPYTVYTCPANRYCAIARSGSGVIGASSINGTFFAFYQTGPASTVFEIYRVAAGESTIRPGGYALNTPRTVLNSQWAPGFTSISSLGPGDSLVVYWPDPSVSNGTFLAVATETPLEQ